MSKVINVQSASSLLLIIDLQVKLAPSISGFDSILESVLKLAKVSDILKIPALITEQYIVGLGQSSAAIKHALPDASYFQKNLL